MTTTTTTEISESQRLTDNIIQHAAAILRHVSREYKGELREVISYLTNVIYTVNEIHHNGGFTVDMFNRYQTHIGNVSLAYTATYPDLVLKAINDLPAEAKTDDMLNGHPCKPFLGA